VRDLRVSRARPGGSDTLVSSVSLSLRAGETIGMVGESGSGKSMTAKAVTGLLPPGITAVGEVLYGGRNLLTLREREWRAIRGQEIGLVLQDPFTMLNPVLRCAAIIAESMTGARGLGRAARRAEVRRRLGGQITIDGIAAGDWSRLPGRDRRRLRGTVQIDPSARDVRAQVGDLLASVGLPAGYAQRRPSALSGGERQRVAIARALAVQPRVLICDEPVSALDVSVQAQILNLLTAIRAERGLGYLFITHDLSIVRQITDYLYVMHRGRIVESGPTEEVLTSPADDYTIRLLESVPRPETDWLAPATS